MSGIYHVKSHICLPQYLNSSPSSLRVRTCWRRFSGCITSHIKQTTRSKNSKPAYLSHTRVKSRRQRLTIEEAPVPLEWEKKGPWATCLALSTTPMHASFPHRSGSDIRSVQEDDQRQGGSFDFDMQRAHSSWT
jgi:hypothetical protein